MMLKAEGSEGWWLEIHRSASPMAVSSPVLFDMREAPRKEGSVMLRITGP